jgi:hypothetical protein
MNKEYIEGLKNRLNQIDNFQVNDFVLFRMPITIAIVIAISSATLFCHRKALCLLVRIVD